MTYPHPAERPQPHNSQPQPGLPPVVSDGTLAQAIIARRRARAPADDPPNPVVPPGEPASSYLASPDEITDVELISRIAAGGSRPPALVAMPAWSSGLISLASCNEAQLMAALGINRLAARRVLAAFLLHRRLLANRIPERPWVRRPEEAIAIMLPLVQIDHERLWCLPLNANKQLIGQPIEVARGDVDGTDAGPRAICRAALRAGATTMVAIHPSGEVRPSAADAIVTKRLAMGGDAIDIRLHDHLIISPTGRWCSLRREQPGLFV
jgi:DNA repair protein RadC